jgi:hypothetical protein
MDNDNKRACECGQCFFLAEPGSKYCKHHRNVMENYDRKYGRVEGEAAPHKFDPNTLICDNCGFVCDGQNNECPQAIGSVTGGSPAVQKLAAPAPQAATPDAELDEKCKHGIYLEQCDECDGPTFEGNDFMESQAEAPRPEAPTAYAKVAARNLRFYAELIERGEIDAKNVEALSESVFIHSLREYASYIERAESRPSAEEVENADCEQCNVMAIEIREAAVNRLSRDCVDLAECSIEFEDKYNAQVCKNEDLRVAADQLAKLYEDAAQTIHRGQFHQWQDFNVCDKPHCKEARTALANYKRLREG